jgi:hypothetical protein
MRHGWAFLCGVVIALSYLLRGEAVAFIPVFGLVLLIAAVARRIRARSILGLLVALILGWLIPSTPYLVWVHDVSGKWQLSAKTDYNLQVIARVWGSDNPLDLERTLFGVNRQDVLAPSGQSAVRFAVAHRHEMTGLYLSNLLRIAKLAGAILKWWGLGLAGLGVLVLLLQRGRRLAVALLIASAVPMAALPLFHVEERYLYAYIALAQVLAGCGAGWLASLMLQRVSRPFTRHAASFLIAAIVLGGLAFHAKHALKEAVTPGDLAWEHRALGYYIRDYLPGVAQPGGPAIASRLPWVAFYADRENFEYLPFVDTIEELQPACEKFNIGWVVIDGRLVPRLNPALAPLIDPRKAPDWLQPLVRLPSNPPIVLYRVMKQGSSM